MNNILKMAHSHDAESTVMAVAGQREAFAQIVTRYRSLVRSLAYSAISCSNETVNSAADSILRVK